MTRKRMDRGTLIVLMILLCAIALSAMIVSLTLSRYLTNKAENSHAQTAVFCAEYSTGTQSTEISLSGMKPGDTRTVVLTVKNGSNVPITYSLTADVAGAIPLEITFSANTGSLPIGNGTGTHTMTVVWPAAQKDAALAEEIGAVTVFLHYEQEG